MIKKEKTDKRTKPRLTSKQYANGHSGNCPWCLSRDISAGNYEADGSVVTSIVSCEDCGSYWTDVYYLQGYDCLKPNYAKENNEPI